MDKRSPTYANEITRPVWQYLRDHQELGITSGWRSGTTLYIFDATDNKIPEFARLWYDSDKDAIIIRFDNKQQMELPVNTEVEQIVRNLVDYLDNTANAVPADESYYTQGNRDGQKFNPAKMQESFPSRAAYLSYKKGYQDGCDGIYEKGTL